MHRLAVLLFCVSFSPASLGLWNNPYPDSQTNENILYSSFSERPKHLDPVRSYSAGEYAFIAQIYEPPLQYHYLRRPYTLVPLTAVNMPRVTYIGADGSRLPHDTPVIDIAFSDYEIQIQPGIRYQPHPALAKNVQDQFLYHSLSTEQVNQVHELSDFKETGARELVAADYAYQIKRMANPRLHSPIAGVMAQYIVGFAELGEQIETALSELEDGVFLDLRQFRLAGVSVVDRYTYQIRIRGKYPQFLYWQAMPFFAPIPWEVERFYAQPGLKEKNITLDWYPIGTGPFMLTENNPNLRMVMARNPNFHGEHYPVAGEEADHSKGLLADKRKPMPFVDRAVYSLEKESIPRWNKFLQGFYDNSGIASDSFDQAIQFNPQGEAALTAEMSDRGIRLSTAVATSIYYMGFNYLHPVLGGNGERARKLRQAISIAVDFEEFISIFRNGRGVAAQGPIPPGIFGHHPGQSGINPYVYDWVDGRPQRKPLGIAKKLLREAGYPDGIDNRTGKSLVLHFEAIGAGPDEKARLNWIRKQFKKLGIQLIVRATDYNRFREKMLKGKSEIFLWGWNADYPDPENFLFLLYGPNSKAKKNGENASNYTNPEFDRLFEQIKNMENNAKRKRLLDQMVTIARRDAPWMWGFHPKDFSLYHTWVRNTKPNLMANNTLKYVHIDPKLRTTRRQDWNQPTLWPLGLIGGLLGISIIPAIISFRRREKSTAL